jgi:hypothetical protein
MRSACKQDWSAHPGSRPTRGRYSEQGTRSASLVSPSKALSVGGGASHSTEQNRTEIMTTAHVYW